MKPLCIFALNEERVGILSRRQENATSGDTVRSKPMGQLFCSLLAALVGIIIEGDVESAWPVTELADCLLYTSPSPRD